MDFISGLCLGAALATPAVLGFAQYYRKQRDEAREEAEMWQTKFCRHNAFVNALATIPTQKIEYFAGTWSNN